MSTYLDGHITHKRCYMCHEVKPVSDFYRCHASSDGYQHKCKRCDAHVAHMRCNPVRHIMTDGIRPRLKRPVCHTCYSLAHRVRGRQCKECGLQRGLPT